MAAIRFRALRFLWAVLACALLWTASVPACAGSAPRWADTSVLVAGATSGSAEQRDSKTQAGRARQVRAAERTADRGTSRAKVPAPAMALAAKPANTTEHFVLIPRRYLQNLSLLC